MVVASIRTMVRHSTGFDEGVRKRLEKVMCLYLKWHRSLMTCDLRDWMFLKRVSSSGTSQISAWY